MLNLDEHQYILKLFIQLDIRVIRIYFSAFSVKRNINTILEMYDDTFPEFCMKYLIHIHCKVLNIFQSTARYNNEIYVTVNVINPDIICL